MSSVGNLTELLLRHCALDGYEDIHTGNTGVYSIVGDDVHIQVLKLLLDCVHLRFAAPQTRRLVGDDRVTLVAPCRSK
jgi:hypothetical protein